MDCMSMKLQTIDEHNSTRLQMLQGTSFAEIEEVFYDDHMQLVFNHPTESNYAAITTIHDDGMTSDEEHLRHLD